MLKTILVSPDKLLLDPNNPRLARNFEFEGNFPLIEAKGLQGQIERAFKVLYEKSSQEETDEILGDNDETEGDDFFSIDELKESMRNIGFVGIQNIIVREIPEQDTFVVLEGNRRVASIKAVLREHDNAVPGQRGRIQDEEILTSLQEIEVMVLMTDDLTEQEIQKNISTMLGLRHYGSRLTWDLLPRAKNIYDEYMKLCDPPFKYETKIGAKVAEIIAKPSTEVRKLLKGYVCYKELAEMYPVLPHHFSLILAAVENTNLTAFGFFDINKESFQLEGDSAGRMDQVCEFSKRDQPEFDKIIRDPKQFKKLGTIKKDSVHHAEQSVKDYATGLFSEVLEKQRTLEDAYTDLVAFKKRIQWVQALSSLLAKQKENDSLRPDTYLGQGQELQLHTDIKRLVRKFKAIMAD